MTHRDWCYLFDHGTNECLEEYPEEEFKPLRASLENNIESLAYIEPQDTNERFIGIFIGYSSGRGKSCFAITPWSNRFDEYLFFDENSGFKEEYEDYVIDLDLQEMYAVTKIEHWWRVLKRTQRRKAACTIQRWLRRLFYEPPNGTLYLKMECDFYKKVAINHHSDVNDE